jgi:hypothetical protein
MTLNAAGLTALLEDGNDAVLYAAVGDGPLSSDQVSSARVPITWGPVSGQQFTAVNVPMDFSGAAEGPATHVLFFSASAGGTFYGFLPLAGDTEFSAAGTFRLTEITLHGQGAGEPPAAPLSAFTLGTVVGVPTGTTLTASTGLGANDGEESVTVTDPITGQQNTFTATVFRNRRWASTINPNIGPGGALLFENCEFDVASDNFCVDAENVDANGRPDYLHPAIVFRNCSFDGSSTTGKCLVGGYLWLEDCDLRNTEDGWSGLYWSTAIRSNLICTTDGGPDPHSDGLQSAGIGRFRIYNCWCDSGADPASSNAPIRVGTEFSAVTAVDIRYCGLAGSQHGLQMRGDAGAGDITGVTVIGCRWTDFPIYGETDFQEVIGPVTWIDNLDANGDPIPNPVP